MANVPEFIGEYRRGDRMIYPVDNIGWNANYYDVIDNQLAVYETENAMILQNQPLTTDTETFGEIKFIALNLYDEDRDSDLEEVYKFVEGRNYSIILKENVGSVGVTDNPNQKVLVFRVMHQEQLFLGTVEKNKNFYFMIRGHFLPELGSPKYDVIEAGTGTLVLENQSMTIVTALGDRIYRSSIDTTDTDFTVGRTYFIRVKDSTLTQPDWDKLFSFSILPPLEHQLMRLIALQGENLVLDNYGYDQSGNITALRVRLFADSTSADNATQGTTDPESGEVAAYQVTQEHDVPRNVRTFHKSVLDFLSTQYPENP